ncbi:pentapeptide repeat-containing protein [Pseudoruegeria sp. HB172150]|uniref:pentapeptide repeat-containing protein n=1 Tax=Pseudoruegeria sp. HB172150 TaxID=2721164 RepID=UPI001551C11C|nr:pentapeptide repeat-containing protein [Pseudoruegeria sp. HB172150]
MSDGSSSKIPEHQLKDGRGAYLSVITVSVYFLVTVSGATDAELIGNSRQVNLPVINILVSGDKFLWIVPVTIVGFLVYLHILAVNVFSFLEGKLGRKIDNYDFFSVPLYFRWIFIFLPRVLKDRVQVYLSILALYAVPIVSIYYVWWRTHSLHISPLSMFLLLLMFVIACMFFVSLFIIGRMVELKSWSVFVFSCAQFFVLFLVLLFVTIVRIEVMDSTVFARAELSRGNLVRRPEGYVPRFVWARKYLKEAGVTKDDDTNRQAVEDTWYHTRKYYLLEMAPLELDRVDLSGARMNHAFLAGIYMRSADFRRSVLNNADMEDVDASNSSFDGADLSGAHLEQAFLRHSTFKGARLIKAGLEEARLSCAKFEDAVMHEARFDGAFMDSTDFTGANLANASFRGAYGKRADFRGAKMEGADLEGAVLWHADLSTATGLTQEQLDTAVGDENTKLPPGLSIKTCVDSLPHPPLPYRKQWWLEVGWVQDRILCSSVKTVPLTKSIPCRQD